MAGATLSRVFERLDVTANFLGKHRVTQVQRAMLSRANGAYVSMSCPSSISFIFIKYTTKRR